MKINLNHPLKDYYGKPLKQGEQSLDLKTVLIEALNYREQNVKITPIETMQIYNQSQKIVDSKDSVELDIDTLKKIKDNLSIVYHPIVAGQVISYLESLQ